MTAETTTAMAATALPVFSAGTMLMAATMAAKISNTMITNFTLSLMLPSNVRNQNVELEAEDAQDEQAAQLRKRLELEHAWPK